jgi:hypothetical protein
VSTTTPFVGARNCSARLNIANTPQPDDAVIVSRSDGVLVTSPSAWGADDVVSVCDEGSPTSNLCERFSLPRLAAVVDAASSANRYEPRRETELRERCLGALASSSDERARKVLNDYVARAAITIKNEPTIGGGKSRPNPTVDPALPEAVKHTPGLRPYAVEVLRAALVVHAVGTNALQDAVCGKAVPGQPTSATVLDECRAGQSPETGWELTSQRHRRLLVLGAHVVVAAGVMTAGTLTRNEPGGWRTVSVTTATLGGTMGGALLGFAITKFTGQSCSNGALCDLGEGVGIALGAVLGAAAGFGAGMLLSFHGGAGRVAATGFGVGIYLSMFSFAAFHDWNTIRTESTRD